MYQLNGKRWPVKLGLKCFALLRRLTPQHSGDLHRRPDAAASRRMPRALSALATARNDVAPPAFICSKQIARWRHGSPWAKRNELGDTDPSAWETDINGKPRDPWQFTNYLPSLSEKDELFTFAASSRGGISAIARLARRYAQHRKKHPDVYPVIALGVDSYQHPNREYGRIKLPEFTPVGYVPKTKFLAALEAAGLVSVEQPSPPIQPEPGDAFSDEVPF